MQNCAVFIDSFNTTSDLSHFVCGCSTVKSESQRQKFLPKTLKLPTAT